METLGVRNEFVRGNRGRSTLDTKDKKSRRSTILNNAAIKTNGLQNDGYIEASSEDEQRIGEDQDMQMQGIYAVGSRQSLGRTRQSQM